MKKEDLENFGNKEKKEYKLIYTVKECQAFKVKAKSSYEATKIILEEYNEGNIALDNPIVISKSITVTLDDTKVYEIKENYKYPDGYGFPTENLEDNITRTTEYTAYVFETCINEDHEAIITAKKRRRNERKNKKIFL